MEEKFGFFFFLFGIDGERRRASVNVVVVVFFVFVADLTRVEAIDFSPKSRVDDDNPALSLDSLSTLLW